MQAWFRDAIGEYAYTVGHSRPLDQWLLSDYDTWEYNPFYIGPDQGHPEHEYPICSVYATFPEAAKEAKRLAMTRGTSVVLKNYKGRCWAVYY